MTTVNGINPAPEAEAEPDANAQALAAIEAEAEQAGLKRLPRRGESRDAYLLTVARLKGAIPHDAHVTDEAGKVKALLGLAYSDELFGSSPVGKALLTAAAIWPRMNPEIEHVGNLGPLSRRGIRIPAAHLAEALQRDPERALHLSMAEATLLTLYVGDDLVEAVQALRPAIDAAYARIRQAAEDELARPIYDGVLPEPSKPSPTPESVALGRTSQLRPSSLTPILTARDLRTDFPRSR